MTSPQGHAAVLRGGILSQIAQEFLSIDAVLDGPSIEASKYYSGFVSPSEYEGMSYWDDEPTEEEVSIICGTYIVYNGT